MLLDRNYRLRAIAAESLGRFAGPDAIASLKRVLDRERTVTVRVAAVRALVAQYVAGQDGALGPGPDLRERRRRGGSRPSRRHRHRSETSRSAASGTAQPAAARPPGKRSASGPTPLTELGAATVKPGPDEVKGWIRELGSNDYAVWNQAVQTLGACGTRAIRPLVKAMCRRGHDPEFCTRAGIALKAMGPRRSRKIADAMEEADDPLALLILVEVIGSLGQKAQIYRLKELTDRIAERPVERRTIDPMQQVRARAHLELAKVGSRLAIQDLRDGLDARDRPIEIEMLSAVRRIGKRDEIVILLRADTRLAPGRDETVRAKIAEAVRSILRRERIRRNNKMFRTLSPEQRAALERILPPRGDFGALSDPVIYSPGFRAGTGVPCCKRCSSFSTSSARSSSCSSCCCRRASGPTSPAPSAAAAARPRSAHAGPRTC